MITTRYYRIATILGALVVLAGILHATTPTKTTPLTMKTDTVQTDQSLAQYNERPAAPQQVAGALPAAPRVPGCGLTFSFSPNYKVVPPGGTLTYKALVSNNGTVTCTNVSFSVYYSDNETFVNSKPAATADSYYFTIGNLKSGGTYTATITTTAGSNAQIGNQACASADNAKDVCPENLIFVRDGAAVAATPQSSASTAAAKPSTAGKEYGTWIWDSPYKLGKTGAVTVLDAAKTAGFTSVYVTIDDYLTIDASQHNAYFAALHDFVVAAKARGIAVDVEGGARDWAEPANRSKGYTLIDAAKTYTATYSDAPLRGFQYDVEPYLLPQYANDKTTTLKNFVTFIDLSARRVVGSSLAFSVVIPHFYDDEQAWTPSFTYNGTTAYTYTHLLHVLAQKPGSTLIIMAYRNFFAGDDGTKQLVDPEIAEAADTKTRVVVAQETGDVDPAYVTFHGFSRDEFLSEVSAIYRAYNNASNFGGIAVHYLDTYLLFK